MGKEEEGGKDDMEQEVQVRNSSPRHLIEPWTVDVKGTSGGRGSKPNKNTL